MQKLRSVLSEIVYRLRHVAHNGKIRIHIADDSYVVGFASNSEYRRARNFPDHEIDYVEAFADACRDADLVYDIGANVGHFSLVAGTVNPYAEIVAFEPESSNFERLCENIHGNDFDDRACLMQVALGDKKKEIDIFCTSHVPGIGGHRVKADGEKSNEANITVPSLKVDGLVDRGELAPPDLIKIDVEGFEMKVLKGMNKVLENHGPQLFIEVHPNYLLEFGTSEKELVNLLYNFGYRPTQFEGANSQTRHKQVHYLFKKRA